MMMKSTTNDKENLSLQELRANLKATIRKSGVLDTVKAQIRREFITGLSKQIGKPTLLSKEHVDLRERIILSSVYHLFKNRNLSHSLSVYAAESGIDAKSFLLSEVDIIQALNLDNIDVFNDAFLSKQSSILAKKSINSNHNETKSIIDVIIDYCCSKKNTIESSSSLSSSSSAINTDVSTKPVEILDKHLQEVRQSYIERQKKEEEEPNRTIEEKMIIFQRDCEARYKRELELKLQAIKESEVMKIREELLIASQQEAEVMRRNMDSEYKHLMKKYADQEATLKQEYMEREQKLERKEYEARQVLQQELNSLKLKDESNNRKLEYEEQGLRMLELRLKEASILIESREKEISRREKEVEELSRGYQEKAKFEARAYLQSELDDLMREKTAIKIERHRLIEESTSNAAIIESAKLSKSTLQTLQTTIVAKSDEIEELKRKLQLELEKNHKLETGVALQPDESTKLLHEKTSRKEPLTAPKISHIITPASSQMIDVLRKELAREKSKCSSLEAKCAEFEKLVQEQRSTIASLSTQIKKDITPSSRLSTSQLIDNVLKKKESNVRLATRPEGQQVQFPYYMQHAYPEQHYAYPMPPGIMMHPPNMHIYPPYPAPDAQMYAPRYAVQNNDVVNATSKETSIEQSKTVAVSSISIEKPIISSKSIDQVKTDVIEQIEESLIDNKQNLNSQEIEENKQMLEREKFQREAEKEAIEEKLRQESFEKELMQREIELAEKKKLEELELKRLEEIRLNEQKENERILAESIRKAAEEHRIEIERLDEINRKEQERLKQKLLEEEKQKAEELRIREEEEMKRREEEEEIKRKEEEEESKRKREEEIKRKEEEDRLQAEELVKDKPIDEVSKREEEDRLEMERRKALIRERNKKKALKLNESVSSEDDVILHDQPTNKGKPQSRSMNFELSQSDEESIEVPSMSINNDDEFNWS